MFFIAYKEPNTGEINATASTRHSLITTLLLTQFQQNWAHWVYWTTPCLVCWSSENAVKAVCIASDFNLTISDDWKKLIKPSCLHFCYVTNLASPYVILSFILSNKTPWITKYLWVINYSKSNHRRNNTSSLSNNPEQGEWFCSFPLSFLDTFHSPGRNVRHVLVLRSVITQSNNLLFLLWFLWSDL